MSVALFHSVVPPASPFDESRICASPFCSRRVVPASGSQRFCSARCRKGRQPGTYDPAVKAGLRLVRIADNPSLDPDRARLRADLDAPPKRKRLLGR